MKTPELSPKSGQNAQRLLAEVKKLLVQFSIADAERYETNVVAFLNQCPNDKFLEDAAVVWDNEEFDFLWDTPLLDCRFSIGLMETTWRFWAGVNTHHKDDECYQSGVGGMEIEGNEDYFAYTFFESMGWEIKDK